MTLVRVVVCALFALPFLVPSPARAFHSGGVAECGGCHSMHEPVGANYLLVGADQSSTCLACHEHANDTGPSSYHISTPGAELGAGSAPIQRTPGGDFGWLKKTYTYVLRGEAHTEAGESHGHNVVATAAGYVVDGRNAAAPGGTYPSNELACNSCHDPHGRFRRGTGDLVTRGGVQVKTSGSYNAAANEPGTAPDGSAYTVGVYRLLGGRGFTKVSGTVPAYPGVPPAKVISGYNRSEAVTSTRVAYGATITASGNTTWGQWCATCHPRMHSMSGNVHPIDQALSSSAAGNYNRYVKTGDMSGDGSNAFTSLVPFATDGTGNTYANLATRTTSTAGPVSSDRVICLSCHRAHASGFGSMLRWNMEGELLTYDGVYSTDVKWSQGKTPAEQQAAYYDRPATVFAAYQRVLCNKCHAKD